MGDVPQYSQRDVVDAIKKLNGSTTCLATVNIVLTFVILALTAVQVWSLVAK